MARILVADDEGGIRHTISKSLQRQNHTVVAVANGAQALAEVEREDFDLILTDISMPEKDGIDLLHELRSRDSRALVIVMTGQPTVETATEVLRSGGFDYLSKPFTLKYLEQVVARALRVKETADRRRDLEAENMKHQEHLEQLVEERTREVLQGRENLERAQEQLLSVMQTTPHGLCLISADWVFEYANQSTVRIVNPEATNSGSIIGESFGHLFETPGQFAEFQRVAIQQLETNRVVSWEMRLKNLLGNTFWCNVAIGYHRRGQPELGFVATLTDTTHRKEMERQLAHRAFHDDLTGLPNRATFLESLDAAIATRNAHPEHNFAIVYLDIDQFKNINDSFGHSSGDKLLNDFSRRLQRCLRPGDLVARLGGDEFAILLENLPSQVIPTRVADRIHKQMTPPFIIQGREFFFSVSIGIVESDGIHRQPEDYIRDADLAMYSAKFSGRGQTCFFNRQMHDTVQHSLELETDLRRALSRGDFHLAYQPIVSLETDRLHGFEALLRWDCPNRGFVSPGEFIPVAEETGLIVEIGRWVLETACRESAHINRKRPAMSPLRISVNVSGHQIASKDFTTGLREALALTGLDGRLLNLEITESVIMGNTEEAGIFIEEANALGAHVHIDDFGTGYSSLAYLQRFRVRAIKIDRAFVKDLPHSAEGVELVRAIVQMAHNLKLSIVAEGIETAEQAALLRELHVEFGQGFYYSRPLPVDRARKLAQEDIQLPGPA